MKLHEIIEASQRLEYIPFEEVEKRKKQLNTYFKSQCKGEAIYMAWGVFNTGSVGTICPSNEFTDCVENIINDQYSDLTEEEKEDLREQIAYNSIFLSTLF